MSVNLVVKSGAGSIELWRVLKLAPRDKSRVKLRSALNNSMAAPSRRCQR